MPKTIPVGRRKKGRREEKANETREALFSAAATVVGDLGYERASITKIAELAGVANGTFYNYFETRQDLFDQLLPTVGDRLLEHIRSRVTPDCTGVERERKRMAASLDFYLKNPGFMRILNEAEVYAPEAFIAHVRKFADVFERGLKRQMDNGELAGFHADELKTIVYILMGARSYLMMQASYSGAEFDAATAESMIMTYTKLLERGLFSGAPNGTAPTAN